MISHLFEDVQKTVASKEERKSISKRREKSGVEWR
jgi:hypothetical protein